MPPLPTPENQILVDLPPRKATLASETDVLVIGGGPAGIGAAIGASQSGADVVLVERYGFLGGNATAALVMPLMSFHTQHHTLEKSGRSERFLPTDHGEGSPVIAGALAQLLGRLVVAGGAIPPSLETGYVVPFDPELFKSVAMDLLDDHRVNLLFHAFASSIFNDGISRGVVLETKSGPLVIRAKVLIDCTGDGDIAASAGAPFEIGRETDGLTQPLTLMFRMVEFQRDAFSEYLSRNPDQWRGVHGLWDIIKKATDAGDLDLPREDILFFDTPHDEELSFNSTRITKVSGVDVWDLSYAEWEGRKQVRQIEAFMKAYVPGFEKAYVAQTGVNVGVRETRRIIGDYVLTGEDVLNARKFEDGIARCSYPIDVHNPMGKGTMLKRVPAGDYYTIPLRCLIPKETDGLLVAGRCISGSHVAHSSYRVMPTAMAIGQAAGVCAAQAVKYGILPRNVDVVAVKRELANQGALVDAS